MLFSVVVQFDDGSHLDMLAEFLHQTAKWYGTSLDGEVRLQHIGHHFEFANKEA